MRIGYQGIIGSNSEEAAMKIVERIGIDEVVYVPLISSQNVVNALKSKDIDYGVVATKNSIGGIVIETQKAIAGELINVIEKETLPIHHCLFKKSKNVIDSQLFKVVSHIQALIQTEKTRQRMFPGLIAEEIEDTAIGARRLSEGILPDNIAVICRKNAGEYFGLELMKENIEDDKTNRTEFIMFKLMT